MKCAARSWVKVKVMGCRRFKRALIGHTRPRASKGLKGPNRSRLSPPSTTTHAPPPLPSFPFVQPHLWWSCPMPRLILPSQASFARYLSAAVAGPSVSSSLRLAAAATASTSRAAAYSTAPPATRRPFSLESVSTSSTAQPLISAAALDAAVKPRRAVPRPKKAALTLVRRLRSLALALARAVDRPDPPSALANLMGASFLTYLPDTLGRRAACFAFSLVLFANVTQDRSSD